MALSLLPVVFENLKSMIKKEMDLLLGVDKEMKKLESILSTILAVLEDAEQKQPQDKAIQDWLRKLKDATYEVDDILDECTTEALRGESEGESSNLLKKVSTSLLTQVDNVVFRHKIGNRMKEIIKKLNAIAEERTKFHLSEAVVEKRVELSETRETSSVLTQPELYGRDEDREKIVKVLVEDVHDCKEVSVYPILGMGGLGKTTLAQMVFHDKRVKSHFEPRIWVYVSEDFDVKRVIKATIESATGTVSEASNLESLQKALRDMLDGKRFMIVLDDVWNEDQEKWDRLKYGLACGSKGASIITTTRIEKVASVMGTLPPHCLSFLSEDDCWSLFKQRAFGRENEEHPNLVAIGKETVKKCGGVPLAAKALGGLLRFEGDEKKWLFIKESEIWDLPQDENSILPVLRLSYFNLPLGLRRCFAYCAVFPKGFKIEKENLIHLWMANNYISSKGRLEAEDIGNGIWNELYWRTFFQDVGKDESGNITFKMHDLMHDLAHSVMEDECHAMEAESSRTIPRQRIRHVTLVADYRRSGAFPKALQKVESLRTILQQYRQPSTTLANESTEFSCEFTNFGSLRVFDARGARMMQLSPSIGNSKHLRYLNLSYTLIRTLPNSICSLRNLENLNLNSCHELRKLPSDMKQLRDLRHLYLEGCGQIDHMPRNLGQLTLLKTLSLFAVGKGNDRRLAELQSLDIGGTLHIKHLERVRNSTEAEKANLVGKPNLRIVQFSWEDNSESQSQADVEEILEALEPHPNVEKLHIDNYRGAKFPHWMRVSVLQNVIAIVLSNCRNCSLLPAFGQLPCLQRLQITSMDYVEYLDNVFPGGGPYRGFPSLEVLYLYGLPNLKGLSREEGRELLPRLREITIRDCPKLTLPPLSSPEKLVVWRCSSVLLGSISNLHGLTSLSVSNNEDAIAFPEEMFQNLTALGSVKIDRFSKLNVLPTNLESLVSLKSLRINVCHELKSLPEHGLPSLKSLRHLEINHCKNLGSLSEGLGHLTALEKLDVQGCPKLVALPESIRHLNSLRHLILRGRPTCWSLDDFPISARMKTLPEPLQHVPALQSLDISDYPELTSLPEWLGSLTSLQSLRIRACPKVESLPDSIEGLPKLQTLEFWESAGLGSQGEEGRGQHWYFSGPFPVYAGGTLILLSLAASTLYNIHLSHHFYNACHGE